MICNAEIVVPPAVQGELSRNAIQLDRSWIRVVAAQNQNDVAVLREQLDPGEAEAIVVAVESEADPLLVDERIPGMKRGPAAATAAVYVSLETGKLV